LTSDPRKYRTTQSIAPISQLWVSPAAHAPLRSGGSRSSWRNLRLSRSCGRPQFVLRPIQERIAGSSLSLGKPFTAADFSVQRGWRGMAKARCGGNVCTKILLHIQLHNLSQTHPNCPK
jgi:hypothetical protein